MADISLEIKLEKELDNLLDDDFYQFIHEEFYKLMFKYIPYDTGVLASTTDIKLDENNSMSDEMALSMGLSSGNISSDGILFTADYSEDIYYNTFGYTFHKEKHPNATSKWGEVAFNSEYSSLINTINEYLERRIQNGK